MRSVNRNRILAAVILVLAVGASEPCTGAGYPERPVTMLVGLAAGGGNDLIARTLAEALKMYFPQPVSVVNKTGGGASIAAADVAQAKPDGYTLLVAYAPAITVLPHINPNLPYKGPGNFQMISGGAIAPILLASRNNAPWKTLPEMIDYARKNPGKVRLGHAGIGSLGHLCAEDLMQAARVEITLVPFTGAATAITAALGGHVDLVHSNPTPLLGHLRAGTIKNLAVFEDKRVGDYPNVPTVRELGYEVGTHNTNCFVAGPKGLPKEVVQTLSNACNKALKSETFQKFARENALIVDYQGPDELARKIESDWSFYGMFLKKVKLQ